MSRAESKLENSIKDPIKSAAAAGLHYVHDTVPGIKRKRYGKKFAYYTPAGERVSADKDLSRIKALGIPPAYTGVWICPDPRGHLQATGRDAKGRKQYRYHERWREVRDGAKYGRMLSFAEALPKIRGNIDHDLARPGLPREKLLAAVISLLETTMIRVGNEEYARTNNSFGLTTMLGKHVEVAGSTVHFHFRGKSGKTHDIDLKDRRLAKIVQRCQELPGQDLFEYRDEHGQFHRITSSDVNAYLREISGDDFTAKDFRTWAGTVLAALALEEFESFDSETQAKKNIRRAIEHVAERLGNTPAICRKCYVHPEVVESYRDGTLIKALSERTSKEFTGALASLKPEEAAVIALLQERLNREIKKHPSKK